MHTPPADKKDTVRSPILDNRLYGKVGEKLYDLIKDGADLSFVSAYFTIYAYERLRSKLDKARRFRFLFGEPSFIQALDPKKTIAQQFKIAERGGIQLKNQLRQKQVARDCAQWFEREDVEVRSLRAPHFLHGKCYHIRNDLGSKDQHAIMGSSNFTVSGLGLNGNGNMELNMELDSRLEKEDLLKWFDQLWEDTKRTEDVKSEVLRYLQRLYMDYDPQLVYFKTLFELFKEYLEQLAQEKIIDQHTGFYETVVWKKLYEFQKDGVTGVINKIKQYGGCILADSVGLGKTFEALAVIKYFELQNANVLVLCPKKLSDNWKVYQASVNDTRNLLAEDKLGYKLLHHSDLTRLGGESNGINLDTFNWSNFDLVVIDESHNFRNQVKSKQDEDGKVERYSRYDKLMEEIIRKGKNTRVLMLSATPVNNTLKDLRNQIYFITHNRNDALKRGAGITHIGDTIKAAQQAFTKWTEKSPENRELAELMEKLPASFISLLDSLTIARSRKHVKNYYQDSQVGEFPIRLRPKSETPAIDLEDNFLSHDKINHEISDYKLSLYNPTYYVKQEHKAAYEERLGTSVPGFSQEKREQYLIGMMKINFLKRLESSVNSFERTMDNTINKINGLREELKAAKQKLSENPHLKLYQYFTAKDLEESEGEEMDELFTSRLQFNIAHMEVDAWLKDLKSDHDQLSILRDAAARVTPERDAKMAHLKKLVQDKVQQPINEGNKKVLIFSAFADTARYLYDNLHGWALDELGLNCGLVLGSGQNKTTFMPPGYERGVTDFDTLLTYFSPRSKRRSEMKHLAKEGEIDLLIATDCISEGQNLQDCDYLINYDIHWNPVRVIQRFGRIDRLGSINKEIQLVNFWPTDDLDQYINLKHRVEARMALVDVAAGGDDNVLTEKQLENLIKDDLKYRDKQLKKLKDEVLDLEDMGESVNLSDFNFDQFRQELLNFLESNRDKMKGLPLGIQSIIPAPGGDHDAAQDKPFTQREMKIIQPGAIFCLRLKNPQDSQNQLNRLHPHYLVYIREDGKVRYAFTQPQQILEMYRKLCFGQKKVYRELSDLFNQQSEQGQNVSQYGDLLNRAVEDIQQRMGKGTLRKLFESREAMVSMDIKQDDPQMQYELVTWLMIK